MHDLTPFEISSGLARSFDFFIPGRRGAAGEKGRERSSLLSFLPFAPQRKEKSFALPADGEQSCSCRFARSNSSQGKEISSGRAKKQLELCNLISF